MNNKSSFITEHGCAKCGARIMKSAPPNIQYANIQYMNKCNECGNVTDPSNADRFQCSQNIQHALHTVGTDDELRQLRLYPSSFDFSELNVRLIADGRQTLEVDLTTPPPTVCELA